MAAAAYRFTAVLALFLLHLTATLHAAPLPDLQITNFSVYSTLVNTDGNRLVVCSFRVTNAGTASAAASFTLVKMATSTAAFSVPALKRGESAYISQSIRTNTSETVIQVTADATNAVKESDETNNVVNYIATLDPAENDRWQSIGPTRIANPDNATLGVGRVTTIALNPRSQDALFAGARGSGLWMTFDAGQTWTPVTDSLPSAQIDAVAVDPANTNRIVLASPAGVFQSIDGGSVWTQLTAKDLKGIGSDGGHLLIGPNNVLYLSTQNDVLVSKNGGRSWTSVLSGGGATSLQFSTTDATHLFAAITGSGVFEAVGQGLAVTAWHKLAGCPASPLPSIAPGTQVWIAESQGSKWVSLRTTTSAALWRTTGQHCQTTNGQEDAWEQVPLSGPCSDRSNQWSYLFARPSDASVLFKGGVDLCRSGDAGTSFTPVGPVHGDQHAIAVTVGNPSVLYAGGDGGIYRSDDAGASWRFIGEGLANTEFYDLDNTGVAPARFLAGTQDNTFETWNGSSPVWNAVPCPDPSNCGDVSLVAFDRNDKSIAYEIGQSTEQLNSYKNGASEQGIGDDNNKCQASDETPTILRSLVSTGISLPVLVTCNGLWLGPPWTKLEAEGTFGAFVRAKLGTSGMWLVGTSLGNIQGGTSLLSFNPLFSPPTPKATSALAVADAKTFYVGLTDRSGPSEQGSRVYRLDCQFGISPSCGSREIAGFLVSGEVMAIAADPLYADTILVAIRGKGMYRGAHVRPVLEPPTATAAATSSTARIINPGLTNIFDTWRWSPYNNGLPVGVTVTSMQVDANGNFALGTFGRGAFVLHSGASSTARATAIGRIASFHQEPLWKPVRGRANPSVLVLEIDSRPGWVFTAAKPGRASGILRDAYAQHRSVALEYIVAGPLHGTIVGARNPRAIGHSAGDDPQP
jgi:hypothetical protein